MAEPDPAKMNGSRPATKANRDQQQASDVNIPAELLQRAVSGAVSSVLSQLGSGASTVNRPPAEEARRRHRERDSVHDDDSDFEELTAFRPKKRCKKVLLACGIGPNMSDHCFLLFYTCYSMLLYVGNVCHLHF